MTALAKIKDAGFQIMLTGDKLQISPASKLSPNQVEFLKSHRAEIIDELRAETVGLSACDRQTLLDYLAAIGEDDSLMIQDFLTGCATDSDKLAWALNWANLTLKIQSQNFTGLVQCSGCAHLSSGQCQLHGWRMVVANWRECSSYLAQSQKRAEQA